MKFHLPDQAIAREIWICQVDPAILSSEVFDLSKMGSVLALPRRMATTGQASIFETMASLVRGILIEKPASICNTAFAFALITVTLRRNNWTLDISNEEAVQFMARVSQGNFNEDNIAVYLRKKSIIQK